MTSRFPGRAQAADPAFPAPPSRRDDGTTVVELMVAMLVSSIVLTCLVTTFVGGLATTRFATTRSDATAEAKVALESVTRKLRVAVPPPAGGDVFVEATAHRVVFYASLGGRGATAEPLPTMVEFSVDAGLNCLVEARTPATGTAPPYVFDPANRRATCVARGDAAVMTAQPLFVFYKNGGTVDRVPVDPAGAVAPADLNDIRSIDIDLAIRPLPADRRSVSRVLAHVTLVNLPSPRMTRTP